MSIKDDDKFGKVERVIVRRAEHVPQPAQSGRKKSKATHTWYGICSGVVPAITLIIVAIKPNLVFYDDRSDAEHVFAIYILTLGFLSSILGIAEGITRQRRILLPVIGLSFYSLCVLAGLMHYIISESQK